MTFAAALTELKATTFTGLVNSYDQPIRAPKTSELPALIIEAASQPFVEGLVPYNIALTMATYTTFIDHLLLVEGQAAGTHKSRWDKLITYTDRYLTAVAADLTLNSNLSSPLAVIIVQQGQIVYRTGIYSGIVFRHRWEIAIP